MYRLSSGSLEGLANQLNRYLSNIEDRLDSIQGTHGNSTLYNRVVSEGDIVAGGSVNGLVLQDDSKPPSYWKFLAANDGTLVSYQLGGSYEDDLQAAERSGASASSGYAGEDVDIISGTVGGWAITATTLSNNQATLDSAGKLTLGSGSDVCIIDANDATYRLAIGSSTYANAFFSVEKDGTLKSTAGVIGGWSISASALTSPSSHIILNSTSGEISVGSDITIHGAACTIEVNNILLDGPNDKMTIGTSGIEILGASKIIQSVNFTSGPLGHGWRVGEDEAEFNNIRCRGIIRTAVFQKDVISCVNGMVLVSSADVLATDMTASDTSHVVIEGNTTFVVGEILRMKDELGASVYDEWLRVSAVSGDDYTVVRDLAGSYGSGSNPAWTKGVTVVSMGRSFGSGRGFILLDSSSTNSPVIQLYRRNSTTYNDYTEYVRIGNMNGFLGYGSECYGFGVGTPTGNYLKYDQLSGTLSMRGVFTIQGGSDYAGNVIGTTYTSAKCTDANADQTSANTANNASNYSGNLISTTYTSAKCTDANADETGANGQDVSWLGDGYWITKGAPGANVLGNGGFDEITSSSVAPGWQSKTGVSFNTGTGHGSLGYCSLYAGLSSSCYCYYVDPAQTYEVFMKFPVTPGDTYEFGGSGRKSTTASGSTARVRLAKSNASGISAGVEEFYITTTSWADYDQKYTVGVGIHFLGLYVRVASTTTVTTADFDNLYVRKVDATTASWWHSSDNTTIDGGNIYTGTVTASQILTNTLTATQINGGSFGTLTITSGKIAINTTDALEIQASGNIKVLAGGDIDMYGSLTSASKLNFYDPSSVVIGELSASASNTLHLWPATTNTKYLTFGSQSTRWYAIAAYSSTILMEGYYSSTEYGYVKAQGTSGASYVEAYSRVSGTSYGVRLAGNSFYPVTDSVQRLGMGANQWERAYVDRYYSSTNSNAASLQMVSGQCIQFDWGTPGNLGIYINNSYYGYIAVTT